MLVSRNEAFKHDRTIPCLANSEVWTLWKKHRAEIQLTPENLIDETGKTVTAQVPHHQLQKYAQ